MLLLLAMALLAMALTLLCRVNRPNGPGTGGQWCCEGAGQARQRIAENHTFLRSSPLAPLPGRCMLET